MLQSFKKIFGILLITQRRLTLIFFAKMMSKSTTIMTTSLWLFMYLLHEESKNQFILMTICSEEHLGVISKEITIAHESKLKLCSEIRLMIL